LLPTGVVETTTEPSRAAPIFNWRVCKLRHDTTTTMAVGFMDLKNQIYIPAALLVAGVAIVKPTWIPFAIILASFLTWIRISEHRTDYAKLRLTVGPQKVLKQNQLQEFELEDKIIVSHNTAMYLDSLSGLIKDIDLNFLVNKIFLVFPLDNILPSLQTSTARKYQDRILLSPQTMIEDTLNS
jgi:hypothetical protein